MDLKEQKVFQSQHRHPWELARAKSILELTEKYVSEESVLLDFGCGDLFFIQEAVNKFNTKKAVAYDIGFTDKIALQLDEQYPKINVINDQNSLNHSLRDHSVDVVFLMDVIEHIEDDEGILEYIYDQEWFTEKTSLIITVPAFQSLFTSHDVFLEHYRRYTNKSLKRVVKQVGFEIKEYGYFFSSLLLPRLGSKIKESLFSPNLDQAKSELTQWNGSEWITNSISNTLYWDFKINHFLNKTLNLRPPGLSNYIVCQKPA